MRQEVIEGFADDDERVELARSLVATYDKSMTPRASAWRQQIEEIKERHST